MVVYIVINPDMHSHEAVASGDDAYKTAQAAQQVIEDEKANDNEDCNWFVMPLTVVE